MTELLFHEIMKKPDGSLIKVLDHSPYALYSTFCEGKLKKDYNSFTIESCGTTFEDNGNKQFTFIQINPKKSFSQRISERVSSSKLTRGGKTRRHKKPKRTKRNSRRH